jgi:hypothetical protein
MKMKSDRQHGGGRKRRSGKAGEAGSGKRRMAAKWRLISGSVINKRWRFRLSRLAWRKPAQASAANGSGVWRNGNGSCWRIIASAISLHSMAFENV